MDAAEIITRARRNLGDPTIDNVKDAVLALHGSGAADDEAGDVESPVGHAIRVDRFIVTTDSQGFTELVEYEDTTLASQAFAEHDDAYTDWSVSAVSEAGADVTDALRALYRACDGDEAAVGEVLHESNKAARATWETPRVEEER